MEIKIKKIWFGNSWEKMRVYAFSKKINIIEGVSGSGKTPMMALLGYAICNSYMRNFYFEQRNKNDSGKWKDEIFCIDYLIAHNNINLNIVVTLETDINNEKIYMSAKINEDIICIKSDTSKFMKDALLEKLGIPKKVFWSNTVIKRNFNEFHCFFFVIPNMNIKQGFLYDIAQPYKAYKNSFTSAYIFLKENKKGIEILKQISKLGMITKVIEKKSTLSKFISSFNIEDQEAESRASNFKNQNDFTLKKIEDTKKQKLEIEYKISELNNKIKKISSNNRIINIIKEYNEISYEKINIKSFSDFLFQVDSEKNIVLPTLIGWLNKLKKDKKMLQKNLNSFKDNLGNSIVLEEKHIQTFILNKVNSIIKKMDENIEIAKNGSDTLNEDLFMELYSSWRSTYLEESKNLVKLIQQKYPGEFDFINNIQIKKGTGGKWLINYLKCFIAMNEIINEMGNKLPLIIDGIFDAGYDAGSNKEVTLNESKSEIIEEIINKNKNQVIIAMTNENWNEIKKDINNNLKVFKSPDGYEIFESHDSSDDLKKHYSLCKFKHAN